MAITLVRGNNTQLPWTVCATDNFLVGSTAGDVATQWVQAANRYASIQLIWTGTTAGTLAVQLSNDGTNVAGTLTTTDFLPTLTNPAGGASSTAGSFETDFVFFRVTFTRSAGTGTIVCHATNKA